MSTQKQHSIDDIRKYLGKEADSLLSHQCKTLGKEYISSSRWGCDRYGIRSQRPEYQHPSKPGFHIRSWSPGRNRIPVHPSGRPGD